MARKNPTKSPAKHIILYFATMTSLLSLILFDWSWRWLISGAPILLFAIFLGDARGARILPTISLYPIFTTINLLYAIASTSWLLYDIFTFVCYPAIVITCMFQFAFAADLARRTLRAALKQLHFIDDKIAFFNIPALEIDTEVDGLMVLRGITFSLSTLSFVVHGVEVGIKLSDDMEMAIQTERVEVKLFRGIWVGDCFANLKGGKYEMTFGDVEGKTVDSDGDQVFVEGTPLLRAAATFKQELLDKPGVGAAMEPKVKLKDHLTEGPAPDNVPAKKGWRDVTSFFPTNDFATGQYSKILSDISQSSAIQEAMQHIKDVSDPDVHEEKNALRAAICSQLHSKPSVPHPPRHSIKVTTLQNLSPPPVRRFLHRLPMLLRLLLNPLSYFHPVHISSITATASGHWIESMLVEKIFKDYWEFNSDISSLKTRIAAWLNDANFAVELGEIVGTAQVPFLPHYDIKCQLAIEDVMAYRALPKEIHLHQVIRLGGADAGFVVPSFLLPHHEHLLPPVPTAQEEREARKEVEDADGQPKRVQAEQDLKALLRDTCNVKISAHARLPAVLSQELLDFVAALAKASKMVEMEKEPKPMQQELKGVMDFGRKVGEGVRVGFKKGVVDGVVNERWIAKVVGKVVGKLGSAKGDLGYSGDLPVALEVYRTQGRGEGEKILG